MLLAVALLAPAAAAPKPAQGPRNPNTDRPGTTQGASGYAVIELRGAPLATYKGGVRGYERTAPRGNSDLRLGSRGARNYGGYLKAQRADFKRWLKNTAPWAKVVEEFDVTANAVAIKVNSGISWSKLRTAPNVKRVSPSALYRPSMNVSPELIDAPELWNQVGGQSNAGKGMRVGVIDTGIDLTSPFFDDAGYPATEQTDECSPDKADSEATPGSPDTNNKVIVCRVYASGKTGKNADGLIAFDHGTHVAGTVAGNDNTSRTVAGTDVVIDGMTGIAPEAYLGDYNVFPGFGGGYRAFGGSAFSHDIAAAIEDAVIDGMDVANLSLGGTVQGPNDFLAEAVNTAVEAGMVVAVAAGNSGPGDSTVESPGSAIKALTAGASTNPHFVGIPVTLGTGETYGAAVGDFNPYDPPVTNQQFTVTTPANGCTAITDDVAGNIAVIDRGACTFTTKIANAEDAGAVGVLVVNNSAGDPTAMAHDGSIDLPSIPAAMVGKNEGAAIKTKAGTTTMTVDGTSPQEFITENEDIIAAFSSRGPTPFTYNIKPDITGPGVNVVSSVFNGEFAFFQGTSMATPHVAGAAALLLQAHEDWTPDQVKSALVNTAKRPVFDHVTGTQDTGVLTRGGGRIDLDDASNTPVTIVEPSVSFGLFKGNQTAGASETMTATNVSDTTQTCAVSAVTATGDEAAVVTASPSLITLAPDESRNVTATLNGGRSLGTGDYEGDIRYDCTDRTLLAPWWTRVDRKGGGGQ